MRLLLDECVPRKLRNEFRGHDVQSVTEMGWSSERNGELLRLATSAGFDCVITVDRNMSFQQKISESGLALIVMCAKSNRLCDLLPLVSEVLDALQHTHPGRVIHVPAVQPSKTISN